MNATNKQQIYYVGHSQGGTSFLVTMSTKPEYNEKIRLASLFATSAILIDKNIHPLIGFIGPYIDIVHVKNQKKNRFVKNFKIFFRTL